MKLSFWLGLLLRSVVAYVQWKATLSEIQARKLIFDLKEEATKETNETQDHINDLRASNRNVEADRLRDYLARRVDLTFTLPTKLPLPVARYINTDEAGDLHSTDGRDLGFDGNVQGLGESISGTELDPKKTTD